MPRAIPGRGQVHVCLHMHTRLFQTLNTDILDHSPNGLVTPCIEKESEIERGEREKDKINKLIKNISDDTKPIVKHVKYGTLNKNE